MLLSRGVNGHNTVGDCTCVRATCLPEEEDMSDARPDPATDDVLRVEARAGGPIETNTYLLIDTSTGAWALVDPTQGLASTWRDRLDTLGTPEAIFITHGHFDHVGGLAEARRLFPETRVWVHPDSARMLEDAALNGSQWVMAPYEPATATDLYREGDTVAVGSVRFEVFDTPGHCPGSVCLLHGRHLIAGDVLFQGSVGRWDLPGADFVQLADSICNKLMPLPDDTVVYAGHGPATTIGRERRENSIVRQMLAGIDPGR